ncbi:hypothetical protein G7Y89_g6468 [Cudoniella acicularis]|uniref:Uncharacterized protein n=1 Tax=Cudoniella acicularis TaxID=354080 RepID=A0A8H4RKE7_9HELO|nr:hypothetical protein G7Y89_g6468 [Cudoniella acicularis]
MKKIFYNSLPQRESYDGPSIEGVKEACQPKRQPTHLKYDVPVEIVAHSDFDSTNRTIQDQAWDDPDLEPWSLFLALDDDYSASMGLPPSQRWPWDEHKGAYIPIGAHELHCVRVIRSVINENHDGLPQDNQTWPYGHAVHCLNVLRDSVVCHADDTPMYTGRLHKNVFEEHPRASVGTFKMCRNWSALVSWARARSACYRPVHWFEQEFDETERYKFCPDGSTPWKQAEGKGVQT